MSVTLKILFLLLFFSSLDAEVAFTPQGYESGGSVVPNDTNYYKATLKDDVELIYSKKNIPFAKHVADVESKIAKEYKALYGWELDERLYVTLASSHNQIANAFSSQWPNNSQVNYMGGTQLIDKFSSTSWLDTLLYHESAHNYQYNVKGSAISRGLHSLFGNGFFLFPSPFIVPNIAENSFMLEGNAVLNESWHGNGGRLYSGLFRAQTILQAEAGNIVASDVYNQKQQFPYGDIHYIQGGFYNLFVAQKYGMKNLNSYFKNYSSYWYLPLFTNASMRESVGRDFETTLEEFSKSYKTLATDFIKAKGERVASSQFYYSLNSDKEKIFFTTNESGVRAPELLVIDKQTQQLQKRRESFIGGKVIKVADEYFTQGSKHTSLTEIHQGLFDSDGFVKKGTESKMIQGYLSDGRALYFDVASSFAQPQLYVDGKFYARVNSSVFIDTQDNIYYFKQEKKVRTLYKNRTPLLSYRGFYGIVSDVDSKGSIYFIANSKLGSTLYRYRDSKITRASNADNIAGAKLLNDKELLLCAINDKEYYYVKSKLTTKGERPYEVKLFFEDESYYGDFQPMRRESLTTKTITAKERYRAPLDMHYSATELGLYYTPNGLAGTLNINFADPLMQNSFNAFAMRDDENISMVGVGYSNSMHRLSYNLSLYSVVDNADRDDIRDFGVIADVTLPLYRAGYYSASLFASLYQDYQTEEREPITFSLNLQRGEQFGYSLYANYLQTLDLAMAQEREDKIYSVEYNFQKDLPYEFYFSFGAKYAQTSSDLENSNAQNEKRGVKVSNFSFEADMDKTALFMPSIESSYYFKSASYAEVSLRKVINISSYWFTFPLSLQRESLGLKYRRYELTPFSLTDERVGFNESSIDFRFYTVLFNKLELPITLEYIVNDSDFLRDESKFKFSFDSSF